MSSEDPSGTELLERAIATTTAVLGHVEPDALDGPTPCADWDVRALVNHLVGASAFFAVLGEGGDVDAGDDTDATEGDYRAAFEEATARAVAAYRADGAMERRFALPTGPTPGSVCVVVAAGEIYQHGWDLASATGQPTALDPSVAQDLLDSVWPALCDQVRASGAIGPAVAVPGGAPVADRLAGFLGRVPLGA